MQAIEIAYALGEEAGSIKGLRSLNLGITPDHAFRRPQRALVQYFPLREPYNFRSGYFTISNTALGTINKDFQIEIISPSGFAHVCYKGSKTI